MKCALCNSKLASGSGGIDFQTQSLGKILVPNLKYLECVGCGEKLLTPKESDKAAEYMAKKVQEQINKIPIGEFITANEASGILRVTKQAFSKNPKIKRGFIYATKIGDRKYYNKKSVQLFRKKDNGKYPLNVYTIQKYSLGKTVGPTADDESFQSEELNHHISAQAVELEIDYPQVS